MFIYLLYKRKACGHDGINDVALIFNPTLVLKVCCSIACLLGHPCKPTQNEQTPII